jgi:DNA-binding transcriptional LysR family regulator
MLDELRAMAIFAKTVEAGSFRGAARALGLSASVVSHHVAQLEARLDVVLLYRSTRRISLTGEGEKLLEASRAMIAAAESGLSQMTSTSKSPSGRLSVAAPAALISSRLLDDLAAFASALPHVRLTAHFSDAPLNLIGEGIDVAIRAGSLADSNLKSKKLFEMPRRLVASKEYLASRPSPRSPGDLAEWDWIKLRSRPAHALLRSAAGKEVRVEFASRLVVDNAEAMLQFSRRGLGLATPPLAMVEPDLRLGRMVEVLPRWRLEAPSVYAVWPANAPRSGLGMRLISFLEERLKRQG